VVSWRYIHTLSAAVSCPPISPVLIVPAIGIAGARAYQGRIVTRAQLALEQLLDQLERADYGRRGPESFLGAIVAAATALPPRKI